LHLIPFKSTPINHHHFLSPLQNATLRFSSDAHLTSVSDPTKPDAGMA